MIKDYIRNACKSLGRNNDPVIAVLGIAVFKGIFRPLFTMMDKEEKPERKKYAAFREGLTEAIAFCSYLATSVIAKGIAKPLCSAAKRPDLLHKAEKSLSFIAVCLSAAIVIPAVCNLTLKPIMEAAQKVGITKKLEPKNLNTAKLDIKENHVTEKQPVTNPLKPYLSDNSKQLLSVFMTKTRPDSKMKVGG